MKKLLIAVAIAAFALCSGCRTPITIGILPIYQEPVEIKSVQGAQSQYAMRIVVVDF